MQANAFRLRRARTVSIDSFRTAGRSICSTVESYFSRDDAAHIEQVFDDLGLDTRISFDGVEPLLEFVVLQFVGPKDMRPTQHGIQRRAKFVAKRREKLVLHAARELSA